VERDDDVRAACFLALDALRAQFGEDLPYRDALDQGFAFRGRRVPFLSYQKGIYRAAAQRGPAALSVLTSYKHPYGDSVVEEGFIYAYRAGSIDQPDNRALRQAFSLQVPIAYFYATQPGWYQVHYPYFVREDRPAERNVLISPGIIDRTLPEPAPIVLEDSLTRRYAVREAVVRMHQGRFRAIVIPAYRERCTICRLRERRLLDAAHILRDTHPRGEPTVTNGLSLCSIHHRAFDENLVGISPDYQVRVSRRLLEDEDGPMLDVLNAFHGTTIELPSRRAARPDRERLAIRFDEFLARS
jgi:putative restriction endonuclease